MATSAWTYNEFQHIGVDFADPQQVQTYEQRQHTDRTQERQFVQQLGVQPGQVAVEFGPGTGALALALAEAGAQVVAVDISPAMLAYAQTQATHDGVTQVQFIHSGFLTYQHQGPPADLVVTQFAFHHLPDFWKQIALRRIFNIVRSGGHFYLRDVVFSFAVDDYTHAIEAWITDQTTTATTSFSRADFEQHVRDEYSTFGWVLEGMLRRAGFLLEQIEYPTPTYAIYHCRKP